MNKALLTIDIAISTIGMRIQNVEKMLLPPEKGVGYVISWQGHEGIECPQNLLKRKDVEVLRFDGNGLSRNRNNALSHCRGDIVVMTDDDLVYTPESLEMIKEVFSTPEAPDLALFRVNFPTAKPYPESDFWIRRRLPKGYWVSMPEVVFLRRRIGNLQFDPDLGLGSERYGCGEDEMFAISALRSGLRCRFVCRTLCSHPVQTTGSKTSPAVLRGQGVVIRAAYPATWLPRIILKAWRMKKKDSVNPLTVFCHLLAGTLRR